MNIYYQKYIYIGYSILETTECHISRFIISIWS